MRHMTWTSQHLKIYRAGSDLHRRVGIVVKRFETLSTTCIPKSSVSSVLYPYECDLHQAIRTAGDADPPTCVPTHTPHSLTMCR
jgi:hypothetical protein